MMNCNWLLRNTLIKKNLLKEAGVDVAELEVWKDGKDPAKRIAKAFKDLGLKMPVMNNRGVA